MATIRPFRGIYFHSDAGDLGSLITPPYDVIDEDAQEHLYRSNPYNIIRLEYGKIAPSDNSRNNRYSRAAEALKQWLDEGILEIERKPCYYLYEQSYRHDNKLFRRSGLFTALKLEPYERKIILPHEKTMSGPKQDRFKLLEATRTNISPIFMIYPDPDQVISELIAMVKEKDEPLLKAHTGNYEEHLVWAIRDDSVQKKITAFLDPQPLLIADGHHRYETALRFWQQEKANSSSSSAYTLAVLTSANDTGLVVQPTHRLLNKLTLDERESLDNLIAFNFNKVFQIATNELKKDAFAAELKRVKKENGFGYINSMQACLLIPKINQNEEMAVELLHRLLLEPLSLSASNSLIDRDSLSYPHSFSSALEAVIKGDADAAFILDPVQTEIVFQRALLGKIMPQKTTFYYPKLPGGLILRHMDYSF